MASVKTIFNIPRLYHFTDFRNVSSIRSSGGLLSLFELKRRGIMPLAPGGNDWSREADIRNGMDRYVHLCFRREHPMEYRAREDGRIQSSIFLEIDPAILRLEGVKFTPDVANKSGVEAESVANVDHLIDFEVLYSVTDWSDPLIQERLKVAKKYEVLVPNLVPLSLIRNVPHG